MSGQNSTRSFEKVRRIYSERRRGDISIRVSYDVTDTKAGQLVQLKKMEIVEAEFLLPPRKQKKYS